MEFIQSDILTVIMEFIQSDIFTIFSSIITFSTVLILLVFSLTKMKKQRLKKEIEIEELRKTYEKQLYRINEKLTLNEDRWRDVNHLLLDYQRNYLGFNNNQRGNANISPPDIYNIKNDPPVENKLVFVLIPFNELFNEVYATIRYTCISHDYKCIRADEQYFETDILSYIIKNIRAAEFIIAVVDGRNPNVYYELGIAHGMGKRTIMITRDMSSLPFDLLIKQYQLIPYTDMHDLEDRLKSAILRLK